jgi:hypothetical protein
MWNTVKGARPVFFKAGLSGPLLLLLCCNPLVSFEYLDISCSVGEREQYYCGETVSLDFSIAPGRGETERALVLKEGGLSRSPVFRWEGRTLHIKPLAGWKKGEHYSLSLEGELPMEDGRVYTAGILRNFIYGLEGNEFTLLSSVMEGEVLVFRFSKVPSVTSFASQFSLNPGMDYFCDFPGEEVRILPRSPWRANTLYTWTIKGMESADGYIMKRDYTGVFPGPGNPQVPRTAELCPVDGTLGPPYLWRRGTGLDGNIANMEGIGFTFSKPMDQGSLRSGISFYPSIKGRFEEAGEDSVIFFPEEDYRIGTEYRITISQTVKDSLGLSFFEEEHHYFSASRRWLEVENLTLDSRTEIPPGGEAPREHVMTDSGRLRLRIAFSSAIAPANRNAAAESVSLSKLFPLSANNPALVSAKWEDGGAVLILSFENLSPSESGVDNYYQIKIASGGQGPVNGAGEYLEEDLWYVFKVL